MLGGATVIMFGASVELDRRASIIIGTSLVIGLGVTYEPEILNWMPSLIKNIFSGISAGGLTAIVLNLLLPKHLSESGSKDIAE